MLYAVITLVVGYLLGSISSGVLLSPPLRPYGYPSARQR